MDLSIIIVNFNTKKLTLDCIKSIIKSKLKVGYEIIVVDNGSTDKIPKSKFYELIDKACQLKLITNEANLGFARANNQGIKIAKGKYVLLLNSDTVVKDGAVEKLYEFAEAHEDAGVVGSKLLNKDGSVQNSVFHFPTIINAIRQFWFGEKNLFGLYVPETFEPTTVNAVVGASFLITPKAREKLGVLDERYFFYYEDLDYCKRVWDAGLKVYYVPDAEIIHLKGASGKALVNENEQWKRLVPSSKIYNGIFGYYILFIIMWLGQKIRE